MTVVELIRLLQECSPEKKLLYTIMVTEIGILLFVLKKTIMMLN